MTSTHTVGVLVGSLSTRSINRRLAGALMQLAPASLSFREIGYGDLPLYCYDFDEDYPPAARAFKHALSDVDALLFVMPEYNRSIPGPLKNAIDWGSRPRGQNGFARKPSAVIGTSPGKIGTAVGQQHLRNVLSYLDSPPMTAPEAYIEYTPGLVADDGRVTVPTTEQFLRGYMQALARYVERMRVALAPVEGPQGPR